MIYLISSNPFELWEREMRDEKKYEKGNTSLCHNHPTCPEHVFSFSYNVLVLN